MLGNKEIMARNIKFYMNLRGKTATDICNALGFKNSTFSNWVNGKIYPRIDKIEMLANYFGVSKADLVEEHNHFSDTKALQRAYMKRREAENANRIELALELYSNYEQAPQGVRETIDMILKSAQQKS